MKSQIQYSPHIFEREYNKQTHKNENLAKISGVKTTVEIKVTLPS